MSYLSIVDKECNWKVKDVESIIIFNNELPELNKQANLKFAKTK
jgi:hypothetical protein